MTLLSSNLDRGENIGVVVVATVGTNVQSVRDIEPNESTNMSFLFAFEWTQAAPQSC